ncbi:hypothetical protein [Owenweeksia hongkongensis]|uniref:Uncharacterized protein n=1 Tax=Owenweeksia hongkongensis (strain DSM 17368 / CIP 108786 / JCM 12287 / NRRL B-23963 / UST20020801) TaxID=926562 RepID=G8R062_OWEHD|nr:hypothetical protein [Owenweeksia hongkongensis]AEV33728.1 hypothetical protein Oweho_2766 [Owenweeksia hongkongensis DSM 17368]
MAKGKVTPGVLVSTIRENQNNNKTLKALFASQFLGKLSEEELDGLTKGIEKEMKKRSKKVIAEKIEFLKKHGYSVNKG